MFDSLGMLRRWLRTRTRRLASPGTTNVCLIEYAPVEVTEAQVDPSPFVAGDGVLALEHHTRAGVGRGHVPVKVTLLAGPVKSCVPSGGPLRVTWAVTSTVLRPLDAPCERT